MDNLITYCQDIVVTTLTAFADLFNYLYTTTIATAITNIFGSNVEMPPNIGGILGMSILELVLGGGLIIALLWNIIKWVVGVVTGS